MLSYLLKKLFWHNLNNFSTKITLDFAKPQHIQEKKHLQKFGDIKNNRTFAIHYLELFKIKKGDNIMAKKFKCLVCGYVHEGETAPEECPLCFVGPEDFKEITDEDAE